MDGVLSAAAQEVRSARPFVGRFQKMPQAPAGRISARKRLAVTFRLLKSDS